MITNEYDNAVYAGVLGKIIGVFLGRPIEGWPYERIREKIGIVNSYVHKEAGTPLIVADDDIAGTFTFFNAVEDCYDISKLTSYDFGETWLDYVIEDKTIFWWGGLGRSTEHTAFLRLKEGIKAPQSGSIALNGQAVAEQIGAQIFIDAFSMMCPGDPEKARYFIKEAASVSHDGIAVESACLIGAMQAQAFVEKDIDTILNNSISTKDTSYRMNRIIEDVRNICQKTNDWRKVRDWLDKHYGYDLYPGNCHVIPNLSLILASILLGGDDFGKALEIAVSSGWDTDCNAANIGCFNGIRLGLDSINANYDFRTPLAERMYVISSNGGECVSDAVLQTRRIIAAKKRLYNEEETIKSYKRFEFEYNGSVQGFCSCPFLGNNKYNPINANTFSKTNGLFIECDAESLDESVSISTPVMWDPKDYQGNYCLIGSPTLYSGQTVCAEFVDVIGKPKVRLYIAHYDFNDKIIIRYGDLVTIDSSKEIKWEIPDTNGMPIARIGVECVAGESSEKSSVVMKSMNWEGAPKYFSIKGSLRNYDMSTYNMVMQSFTSSAKQFSFDSRATFTISHIEENGVATIGTQQWDDYIVESYLCPGIHKRFGLVARSRGHRRYYAAVMWGGCNIAIIKKTGSNEEIIAKAKFKYEEDNTYKIQFKCNKDQLAVYVDDELLLECVSKTYSCGGAGFIIDCGTVLAHDFTIQACL